MEKNRTVDDTNFTSLIFDIWWLAWRGSYIKVTPVSVQQAVIWHKSEYTTVDILYKWDSTAPEMSEYVYLELPNVEVVLRSIKTGMCDVVLWRISDKDTVMEWNAAVTRSCGRGDWCANLNINVETCIKIWQWGTDSNLGQNDDNGTYIRALVEGKVQLLRTQKHCSGQWMCGE